MAAQKAIINVPEADIYEDNDFDSEVVDMVRQGETYVISNKTYGAFYKIKLKSGKMGYIPDHEVIVNGKSFEAKPFKDGTENLTEAQKKLLLARPKKEEQNTEAQSVVTKPNHQGVSVQVINFHEETLGTLQVDNLYALGYKNRTSALTWEVFGSFQAPKYYAEKTKGTAQGFHLWALGGVATPLAINARSHLYYAGSFMAHAARIKVDTPAKSYDLQDLTVGFVLEGGCLIQFKAHAFELSVKYYFDRNNYGSLGLSLLF